MSSSEKDKSVESVESVESVRSEDEVLEVDNEIEVKEIELSQKQTSTLIHEKKANIENVKTKGKSDVWQNFGKVLVSGLNQSEIKSLNINIEPNLKFYVKNTVACKQCFACYIHVSHKSGTSSLRRHKCAKKTELETHENAQLITKWCTKTPKTITVPETIKYELQVKSLKFILNQLLAFKTIDEKPFRELLQKCIEIGSNYGNTDINDLLCSRKKLTKVILKRQFDECMTNISTILNNSYGLGLTLDFWQEEFRKITYVSLTMHFVDENYNLKSRILNSNEFGFDKKTADNIKLWFNEKICQLKIESKKYLVVSDNASNLVAAFGDKRIACICHCINLAIQSAINDLIDKNSEKFSSEFANFVEKSKSIVSHFKHTGMQEYLEHSVKKMVDTRWNSLYIMAKSIQLEYENIIKILDERKELHKYTIDKNLLDEIVTVFKPFDIAINDLSSSSIPTLNIVIPKIFILKSSLKPNSSDSMIIGNLKKYLISGIEEKIERRLTEWHYLALFLDPRFKNSNLFNSEKLNKTKTLLIQLMNEAKENSATNESDSECESDEPISKARKDEFSEFYGDSSQSYSSDTYKEIDYYLDEKFKIPNIKNGNFDPISMYWKSKVKLWPYLSSISLWILSVPSSSARSEETFSLNGWMINKRRSSLKPNIVNMALVVKSKLFS
jgi:hypothetical protein